jgi:hypothetical protein
MQGSDTIFGQGGAAVGRTECEVSLWSDSVGAAVDQIGIVVTLGIVVQLATGWLTGIAKAWH